MFDALSEMKLITCFDLCICTFVLKAYLPEVMSAIWFDVLFEMNINCMC